MKKVKNLLAAFAFLAFFCSCGESVYMGGNSNSVSRGYRCKVETGDRFNREVFYASKNYVTVNKEINGFDEVKVGAVFDVTYTPSGGADPVSKKLGDLTFVQAISADGLQHTVDCTHVQGYTFLTNDSFIFNFKEVSYQTVNNPGEGSTSQNYPLTYNYDSETGMLTYSGGGRHTITSGWDVYITSDIDLYVK